jgi:hypothetical protein
MHLLHSLFFIAAHFAITLQAVHLADRTNTAADAISCFDESATGCPLDTH